MTFDEPAIPNKERDEKDEAKVDSLTHEVNTALLSDESTQRNVQEDGNATAPTYVNATIVDDQQVTNKKRGVGNIIRNIRNDRIYRQKFMHTVILCWSFMGLGWVQGMVGQTFPDLRQIINEDLATASWMFPASSFGYLVGSFVGGFLYDKYNKIILLALSTMGLGVSSIITPFCARLSWMLFVKFGVGLSNGVLEVGANSHLLFIWGHEGDSYMQAMHFCLSLGAFISQYVTEPFLAKKVEICQHITNVTTDLYSTVPSTTIMYNQSATPSAILEIQPCNTSVNVTDHMPTCSEKYETSSVHIAYIIAGIIVLTSTIAFALLCVHFRRNKLTKQVHDQANAEGAKQFWKKLTRRMKVFYLVLLSILVASYSIMEDGFTNFLMTFVIERLEWDKATGSFVTGLFWMSFGIGGFCGIFIIACCRTKLLLTSYLIALGCSYAGFLLSAFFNVFPLIWIFTAIYGFSLSVIFPAIFSWTSENIITVSGKISSLFLTSASSSCILTMFLIGNLMDKYDPMWFVYILVIDMGICFITYAILSASVHMRRNSSGDLQDTNLHRTL